MQFYRQYTSINVDTEKALNKKLQTLITHVTYGTLNINSIQ